jgi:hypothetical protein
MSDHEHMPECVTLRHYDYSHLTGLNITEYYEAFFVFAFSCAVAFAALL